MNPICGVASENAFAEGGERALAGLAVVLHVAHRDVAQRRLAVLQLDQVVALAGRAHELERPQVGQQRMELAGDGPGVAHERVEVVEGGTQVEEHRVRSSQEVREVADGARQRGLLTPDRGGWSSPGGRPDRSVRSSRRSATSVTSFEFATMKRRGVAVELSDQAARRGQRRVEVGQRLAHAITLSGRRPCTTSCNALRVCRRTW
jgi:hypothetical protein